MARIRTIKPQFFKNEELAELTMTCRLLFIGLWTLADKDGKLEDRPKRIKVEVFPYDSINVDAELSKLQQAGFINRYETEQIKVISIPTFSKHQRITGTEATTKSELPDYQPVADDGNIEDIQGNTEETLRKQQGNTLDDRKGKEGKGDIGKEGIQEKLTLPDFSDNFLIYWDAWKQYKKTEHKFNYKSLQSEQASINELVNLSKGLENTAIEIIKQSMAKGWKGFFELKNNKNGAGTINNAENNHGITGQHLHEAFLRNFVNK